MHDESDKPAIEKGKSHFFWFGEYIPAGWVIESSNPPDLLARFHTKSPGSLCRSSYKVAVSSGFCVDRDEYFSILRDFCFLWSLEKIDLYRLSDEARLIKIVIILRETDRMISRVSEQVTLWQRMILPHYESGKSEESNSLISEKTVDNDDSGILLLSNDLMRIKTSRKQIALDISNRSEKILPNCSALVGPLVAARLLAQAGSLTSLARKPASAVQILGARNAFFMHRITGSPPPKHGCIYEHKRVHSAPRKVRGKISRTLAACLAIAARLDCYRGTLDADFQDRAKQRIERAGGRR